MHRALPHNNTGRHRSNTLQGSHCPSGAGAVEHKQPGAELAVDSPAGRYTPAGTLAGVAEGSTRPDLGVALQEGSMAAAAAVGDTLAGHRNNLCST